MGPLPWLLLLLLPEAKGFSGDEDSMEIVAVLQESIILPLEISPDEEVDSIIWSSRRRLAIVRPGKEGQPTNTTVMDPHYQGRVSVPELSYSLYISNLTWEDSGIYSAEVYLRASPTLTLDQHYNLCVYRRLPKPSITVTFETSADGACNISLACSIERAGADVTYSWLSSRDSTDTSHEGPTLSTSWRPGDRALSYICRVSNPVSSISSYVIQAASFCADPGYPEKSSMLCHLVKGLFLLSLFIIVAVGLWVFQTQKKYEMTTVRKLKRNRMKLKRRGKPDPSPV